MISKIIEAPRKIVIINNNYPPNPGITGESAAELAQYLLRQKIEVEVVTTDSSYSNGNVLLAEYGQTDRIRSYYNGKNKILRFLFSFFTSYRLIKRARNKKSDAVIVMTDPPFLAFWASKLLKNQKWFLWSMDLYPDAFIASKLATTRNLFYKFLNKVTYANPPDYLIALGKQQAEYVKKKYRTSIKTTLLPCGIHNHNGLASNLPSWKKDDNNIYLGYCGNIGAAHSLEFVKEVIAKSSTGNYRFVLSVYGKNAKTLKEFASQFNHVIILNNLQKTNLKHIDIHLVTLKKGWEHVCVPSKAISAVCSGSAILFCGSKNSDTWNLLGSAGWFIDENKISDDVIAQLESINSYFTNEKKLKAKTLKQELLHLQKISYHNILNEVG